jgi:3-oxoacyl-[acyl-carrier protein] reductase
MSSLKTLSSSSSTRVALVTGGSRGIGLSIVERLAADGYDVAVAYAGNHEAAQAAVAAVQATGQRAIAVAGDVADEAAAASLFDTVEQTFGGVDVVVHAAGVMILKNLVDFDLEDLDQVLRTNIRGTFVIDQQAARRVRPGGAILNFSSSVLGRVLPTYSAYAASKAAVEALTFILAHELRGRDVTVNAIAPGPTATDMFLEGKDEELLNRLAQSVPLERLGEPGDIAPIVSLLASPEGHWVNGQTLRVNGGII